MKSLLIGLVSLVIAFTASGQKKPIKMADMPGLPSVFTQNIGQWPGDFTLKTAIPGTATDAFFKGGNWTFVERQPHKHAHKHTEAEKAADALLPAAHAWRMRFVNASPLANAKTAGPDGYPATYISDRGTHTTHPTTEGKVQTLYPDIDARLLFAGDRFRFDIIVNPGASVNSVKMAYDGVETRLLKGLLIIKNSFGAIYQTIPKAYQLTGSDTNWVAAHYTTNTKGEVGFSVGKYNKKLPLVIDPTLIFATYSGSRADNWGSTATYAEDGSMFSGGTVFGSGFPVTLGALSRQFRGYVDAGILKYSPNGQQLLWATFLGGNGADDPVSLIADKNDNLYILSITGSSNFPVSANGADTSFGGGPLEDPLQDGLSGIYYDRGSDLAVTRISADGRRLLGSTYLGGSNTDGLLQESSKSVLHKNYGDCFRGEIILDATGHPCIATHSLSTNFTPGRQNIGRLGADGQALALRLSINLDTVLNRISFGGTGLDAAYGLAQDSLGRTFVCGGTASADFPATAGVYQNQLAGGVDGFLIRIGTNWGPVEAATFMGTPAYDQAYLVQIDNQGQPVVVGQTAGAYPRSRDVWTEGTQGGQFIHGFNGALTQTAFSTAYGGPRPNLVITAFLIDVCNLIYVAGWGGNVNALDPNYTGGSTTNLPTTIDAVKTISDGSDFHVLVLNPRAASLSYGTFYGGNLSYPGEHVDGGTSRFDRRSIVYQSACACGGSQSSFPVTPGVYGPRSLSNNCNNAAFKFDFSPLKAILSANAITGCAPFTLEAKNLSSFFTEASWLFDTLGVNNTTDSLVQFTFTKPGQYKLRLRVYNTTNCFRKDSTEITLTVNGFAPLPRPIDTTYNICGLGTPISLALKLPLGVESTRWQPSTYLSDSTARSPVATPAASISYALTLKDAAGCSLQGRVRLTDRRLLASTNLKDTASCFPYQLRLLASVQPGGAASWTINNGSPRAGITDTLQIQTPGRYILRFRVTNDTTCTRAFTDSAVVFYHTLAGGPPPQDTTFSLCTLNAPLQLTTPAPAQRFSYRWQPSAGLSDSSAQNPIVITGKSVDYTVLLTDSNGCKASRRVKVNDRRLLVTTNLTDSSVCQNYAKLARLVASPGGQISWFVDGVPLGTLPFQVLQFSEPGTYTVIARVLNDTTCQRLFTDTARIAVFAPRPAGLYKDTAVRLCTGDVLQLRAPEAGAGYRYTWQSASAQGRLIYTDSLPAAQGNGFVPADQITLSLAQNGCQNTRLYTLISDTLTPSFVADTTYDACLNKYALVLLGTNTQADSYLFKENGASIRLLPNVPYLNQYTGNNQLIQINVQAKRRGCLAEATYTLQAKDAGLYPKAQFNISSQYPSCNGLAQISLFAGDGLAGKASYTFDGSPVNALTFMLPDTLPHRILQTARLGPCTDTVSAFVKKPLLFIGNVVTPNTDSRNDALELPASSLPWSVQVFNRWGRPVADWSNYPADGFPGDKPAGIYYLKISGGGLSGSCTTWMEVVRSQ